MDEAGGRVLGIGELLWDLFPDAPRLGGAPFNVVANLHRLGHRTAFVTAVGDDELGRAALVATDALGVDSTFITTAFDLPTGTVAVSADGHGGHQFTIRTPVAYESIRGGEALVARLRAWMPDAMVFGTLAQRFTQVRELTHQVAADIRPAHRLYDVNLRDGCWTPDLVIELLADATILKLNEQEADVLASILGTKDAGSTLASAVASRHGIQTMCITRGGAGAALWVDGEERTVDGVGVDVVDTVGAGDAFAAGLLHGLLRHEGPNEMLDFANRLGALVASRRGALPSWRPEEVAAT
jgi:fructokinase